MLKKESKFHGLIGSAVQVMLITFIDSTVTKGVVSKDVTIISPSLDRRGGSRTAATSKVELFVIIVIDFQPLIIITKSSTLDVAAVLDPPLRSNYISLAKVITDLEQFTNSFLSDKRDKPENYVFYSKPSTS